ncbi:MAG: hypothetical protein E5Y06_05320 [Mesorhizobium sp.]|nr:MAG: hypothetical protein E5Y06_05320 [Mesorhizobium sp.]TJU98917.1 MAG: hypothetical protein E5Y08_12390 [Mesorhizobium sp.]TJV14578.1 MAG: hypothetical protein E5Y07_25970 [Mesorhizobium sp.]
MRSSQMEKYVWASILYYAVAVVASALLVAACLSGLGVAWTLTAIFGYFALIASLNIWRRRRHPRSLYQIELTKWRLDS